MLKGKGETKEIMAKVLQNSAVKVKTGGKNMSKFSVNVDNLLNEAHNYSLMVSKLRTN